MKRNAKAPFDERLQVVRALRGLPRERAPRTLLPAVLARVGLADTWWQLDSPVGRIFVAHSRAGISMVSRAASAKQFERSFEARYGRPIGPDPKRPPENVKALVGGRLRGREAGVRF